jgi:hypothetical protein
MLNMILHLQIFSKALVFWPNKEIYVLEVSNEIHKNVYELLPLPQGHPSFAHVFHCRLLQRKVREKESVSGSQL